MKIMNVFRLLVISAMVISLQQTIVAAQASKTDSVAKKEYDELNQKISAVTVDSEDAKNALRQIYESYWNGSMNLMNAVRKIKTEVSRVVTSKQDLKKTMEKAIEEIKEGSYWNSFLSGARNLVARMTAPFKSGYGYTEDEKEIAREMIKEFEGPKETLTAQYNDKLKKLNKNILEKNILTERYNAIISQLNNEIHQQQLITGEAMSTQRKLFWATVATGVAVAGATLLASRGSTEAITTPQVAPQVTSTPEIALEPAPIISSNIVMEQGSASAPLAAPMIEQTSLITEIPQTIQANEPEISSMLLEKPVMSDTTNEPTQVESQKSSLDELTSAPELSMEQDLTTEELTPAPVAEQISLKTEIPPVADEESATEVSLTPEAEGTSKTEEPVVSDLSDEISEIGMQPTPIEPQKDSLDEVSGEIQKEENMQALESTEEMVTGIEPASAEQNVALQEIKNELESYRDKSRVFLNELIAQGGEDGEMAKELLNDLDTTYQESLSHYAEEIKEGKDPQEMLGYIQILQANVDKAREDLAQEIQATKEIGVSAETSEAINALNEQENKPTMSEVQELERADQDSTPENTPETSIQENIDQENQSKGAEDNKDALENL
jgi:hypothetical protein